MPQQSILVVEDNADDHRILCEALAEVAEDIALLHAANIGAAWALLTEVPERALPTLVITDHHLPDGCGQDLIALLQACPIRCRLPVVMVSGDASAPPELGVIPWFGKPDTWAGWCALAQNLSRRLTAR